MISKYALCSLSLCLLVSAGCGGDSGAYDGPWGQASGVVRLDGTAVTDSGTVTFLSAKGFSATGQLENGNFKLKYNGGNDLPVGEYSVGVLPAMPVTSGSEDPESFFNEDGSSKVTEEVKTQIPERYHQPGSSNIKITIKEGSNDLKIDLDK